MTAKRETINAFEIALGNMEHLPKWAATALLVAGCLSILAGLVSFVSDEAIDWLPVGIGILLLSAGVVLRRSRQSST